MRPNRIVCSKFVKIKRLLGWSSNAILQPMSGKTPDLGLRAADSALIVVDFQERLCAAMPAERLETASRAVANLIHVCRSLDVPVLVTEQYPRGLGPTLSLLATELGEFEATEKTDFSAYNVPSFNAELESVERQSLVVVGMETHVCVYQTVRDLLQAGYRAHVVADAVLSRAEENRRIGLDLCAAAGAVVSSSETVVFDWLGGAGSELFKSYSRRIR